MSLTYGDLWRLAHPVVRDFVGGLALGRDVNVPRLAVEPNRQLPEPGADAGAWPPEPGNYDKNGLNIGAAGDLARLGIALTIPSVRAFLLGLAQRAGVHSERALRTVAETASALVEVAGSSGLTRDELLDVWRSVFFGNERSVSLAGNTQGAVPLALVGISATRSGVYVADATVAVSDAAVGGSLRISGTYLRSASLALVRSDRRLAQLPPALRDVNAMFTVRGDLIGVEVTGLKESPLSWTLHLNVKLPLPRRKNSE